ncbi:zinc finger, C2H2 type [Ditylenchus destructor]|uniref:Zinc finger, C2H2 type n=1 Tax=Ditylenchus destructor TaxID=166010 RepID=A0AAD4NFW0_9BILA|nr:zinc finger, C2H2 type [Ditylenchus destructor]
MAKDYSSQHNHIAFENIEAPLDSSIQQQNDNNRDSFVCIGCDTSLPTHSKLHLHLISEHSNNPELDCCPYCSWSKEFVIEEHYCRLCLKYVEDLEKHEFDHYRDKLGDDALVECPNCYRTFTTVEQMKAHNVAIHSIHRIYSHQRCFVCSKLFLGRNVRDQHIITHFKSISEAVMENVEELHRHLGENLMSNQCPLCRYVMSTRKSFRHHLIFQHILRDEGALSVLIGSRKACIKECSLVRMLLSSPELLWKRGPLKTLAFPNIDTQEPSPFKKRKLKNEKKLQNSRQSLNSNNDAPQILVNNESPKITETNKTERQEICILTNIKAEQCETAAIELSEKDEPNWMKLKNLLIDKCLERVSNTKFRCKICGENYNRQFSFEVHVAEKHLHVALQ